MKGNFSTTNQGNQVYVENFMVGNTKQERRAITKKILKSNLKCFVRNIQLVMKVKPYLIYSLLLVTFLATGILLQFVDRYKALLGLYSFLQQIVFVLLALSFLVSLYVASKERAAKKCLLEAINAIDKSSPELVYIKKYLINILNAPYSKKYLSRVSKLIGG